MAERKIDNIIDFIVIQFFPWLFLIGINFMYSIFVIIGLFGFGPNVEYDTFIWDIVRYYDSPYFDEFQLGLFVSSFFLLITTQLFVFRNTKKLSTKIFAFCDFYLFGIVIGLLMLFVS